MSEHESLEQLAARLGLFQPNMADAFVDHTPGDVLPTKCVHGETTPHEIAGTYEPGKPRHHGYSFAKCPGGVGAYEAQGRGWRVQGVPRLSAELMADKLKPAQRRAAMRGYDDAQDHERRVP